MGHARPRPRRLAEKLRQVRNALGLSQNELVRRLQVHEKISYTRISDYERDKNEPSLMVLLEYARLAGVHMDVFADDQLDLPARLPGPVKHLTSKSRQR
ncbi:MAG TPA: helix-turn-helix transcriptional regulator [Pyrinomonadaceae bacterium]|jgi:transcriptional regulator with XRE-family HTH domain|nr:helix-turn-helix transcriptional regulator [Pyrinomonadaceae bacterium]